MSGPDCPNPDLVLLTGATGFVGRHCIPALIRRGFRVAAVARTPGEAAPGVSWWAADLTDPGACRDLVRQVRPGLLLHSAWVTTPGRFWSSGDNIRWLEAGIALFSAFAQQGGARAVGVGTCAEYAPGDPVFVESRTPIRPTTVYGRCKAALAVALEAVQQVHGFSHAWGRLFTPYGPGEPGEKLLTAVATSLLSGETVACTDGLQRRDFLFVTDVADALAALLASPVTGPVNIASGMGLTLREVLDRLARSTGGEHLIRFGARQRPPGDADSMVGDAGRLTEEVGWRPSIALPEGLQRTVAALAGARQIRGNRHETHD